MGSALLWCWPRGHRGTAGQTPHSSSSGGISPGAWHGAGSPFPPWHCHPALRPCSCAHNGTRMGLSHLPGPAVGEESLPEGRAGSRAHGVSSLWASRADPSRTRRSLPAHPRAKQGQISSCVWMQSCLVTVSSTQPRNLLSESSSLWACPPPPAGGRLGCWGGLGAPRHQAASCTMTQAVGVRPLFSHFVLCPLQADRVLPALAASVFILSPRKPQLQAL